MSKKGKRKKDNNCNNKNS